MFSTLVIWNPNAGSVRSAGAIRDLIAGDPDVELYEPVSASDGRKKVKIAIEHGCRFVIAAGGDGTVNSVVNGLSNAPREVVLGVLPLGTANDWCASLGIPNDIAEAWNVIERRNTRRLDVVELTTTGQNTRFANIATGGNSHRVTQQISDEMKQRWGALCYIRGAFTILNDLASYHVEVSFDGGPVEVFDVWNLIVANGRTSAGRVEIAPRAQLDDGLLDVVIIQSGTAVDLADLSRRYLFSDYIESDQVVYRQAKEVTLNSNPLLIFSLDGDLIDDQPVSFRCIPGQLDVIVGPEFDTR